MKGITRNAWGTRAVMTQGLRTPSRHGGSPAASEGANAPRRRTPAQPRPPCQQRATASIETHTRAELTRSGLKRGTGALDARGFAGRLVDSGGSAPWSFLLTLVTVPAAPPPDAPALVTPPTTPSIQWGGPREGRRRHQKGNKALRGPGRRK